MADHNLQTVSPLTMSMFKKAAVEFPSHGEIYAALVATPESGLPNAQAGWAFPYFNHKTAMSIVKEFSDIMKWRELKIAIKDDHYDDDPVVVAPVMIDGERYWCLGDKVLVWKETSRVFLDLPEYPTDEEVTEYLMELAHGEYQYHIDDDPKEIMWMGGAMDGQPVFDEYQCGVLTANMNRIRNVMRWDKAWQIYANAVALTKPEKRA